MNDKTIHWAGTVNMDHLANDERFRAIWLATEGIPGSFTRLNAAKLYEYALQMPENGTIVEIGVDQGRSTTILFNIAREKHANLILVDSWESILIDNYYKVGKLRDQFPDVTTAIWREKSADAAAHLDVDIDLLHIDAHHYEGGVDVDCQVWLPKLKSGGVVCFHDYASTFPAVTEAVDACTEDWEDLGAWDSLAIRRKP